MTGRYRVTIPEKVRKGLGVKIGDDIVLFRGLSGACQVMKASEFVKQFREESRDIQQTVRETRLG